MLSATSRSPNFRNPTLLLADIPAHGLASCNHIRLGDLQHARWHDEAFCTRFPRIGNDDFPGGALEQSISGSSVGHAASSKEE